MSIFKTFINSFIGTLARIICYIFLGFLFYIIMAKSGIKIPFMVAYAETLSWPDTLNVYESDKDLKAIEEDVNYYSHTVVNQVVYEKLNSNEYFNKNYGVYDTIEEFFQKVNYVVVRDSANKATVYIQFRDTMDIIMDFCSTSSFFWLYSIYTVSGTDSYAEVGLWYNAKFSITFYQDYSYSTTDLTTDTGNGLAFTGISLCKYAGYYSSDYAYARTFTLPIIDSYNNKFQMTSTMNNAYYNVSFENLRYRSEYIRYMSSTGSILFPNLLNLNTLHASEDIEYNWVPPEEIDGDDFFGSFKLDTFNGLTGILTAPLRLINAMLTYNESCTPLYLTIFNKQISFPSGCTFWEKVPDSIETIFQVLIYGPVAFYLLKSLFKDLQNIYDPNKSKVEVMNL